MKVSVESATTVKPERITFIPPKSHSFKQQFLLFPYSSFVLRDDIKYEEEFRNDLKPRGIKKKTKIFSKDYTRAQSSIVYRNYLAVSKSENFNEEFFIDNEFYVSSIIEMNKKHFQGKSIVLDNGKRDWEYPYGHKTSFFTHIPRNKSVEKRYRIKFKPSSSPSSNGADIKFAHWLYQKFNIF